MIQRVLSVCQETCVQLGHNSHKRVDKQLSRNRSGRVKPSDY